MGVPAKLTERQIKFAELLVYNEGRLSPAECAKEAGYKTRPRQAASELRNPKTSPLVVRYIGELRAEVQEKYGINFEFSYIVLNLITLNSFPSLPTLF